MPSTTIQYFEYEHLPQYLQAVSQPIAALAHLMEETLRDGPEKSAGMRKLLEAKDCFVRASLPVVAVPPVAAKDAESHRLDALRYGIGAASSGKAKGEADETGG